MSDGLTAHETLSHELMWRYLRQLLDRVFGVLDSETVVDDCLDIVVDLLGADRGLVLITFDDGTSHVVNARAQKKSLNPVEREEISKAIIRQALSTRECITWLPLESARPSASMASLGIVAALAAPLHGSNPGQSGRRGVLYVDFRDPRKFVGERHIEFFMSAALLLGATQEHQSRTQVVRDHLREAESHCIDSQRMPPLEELLSPPSMQTLKSEIESALYGSSTMLILGESGTGKTMLGQAIAEASRRRPIVRAVLGSSDDLNIITSELFGHERGAYSGASQKRVGLVEFANNGTLLLDEVLNLSTHAQKLLLDFTQFGTYRPLGYERPEPKRSDVRIIASTNGDLMGAIRDGRFRNDLFQRLAGVVIELPPLRERREDIPFLAERTLARADGARRWTLSLSLRRLLLSPALQWSGNVRQLERVLLRARERALLRDPEAVTLLAEHVEPRDIEATSAVQVARAELDQHQAPATAWQRLQSERAKIDEAEQAVIRQALRESSGVIAHAARDLGIARTTLASRIDALGMRATRTRRSDRSEF
jgi:transcriptional regulator with GAF, ATPase, and Fis domain